MSYHTYRPERVPQRLDAIVIGSGIGGLAVAACLAKAGKAVLVLERHYVAGGFTHTFKRREYEWDVGVHYIGEVHSQKSVMRRALDYISDNALKWAPMSEVYDKIFFGDESYEFVAGVDNFKTLLKDRFPQEARAIDTYIDLVHQLARSAQGFFMEKALPPLVAKIASPFLTSKFMKLARQTTWEVLSSLTQDKKLIGVLTAQWGDYGLPPRQSSFAIHAMVAKHYFDGGAYPVGGSSSFVKTIAPVIEKAGGKVLVKAEVEKVLVRQGRVVGVRLANGDEILAPIVISDAGVVNTYQRLLPSHLVTEFKLGEKLNRIPASESHICLYMGLKHTAQELGLGQSNYWIYPDYDHDINLERFRKDPMAPLPVTYISFPSAKDPTWQEHHPKTATLEAIGVAPYQWFERWGETEWQKRGDDYKNFKERLSHRLLENVYRYVPQVKDKIDYHELSTPLTTEHFSNYHRGEIYGLEHSPERFRQRWLRPHTPIKNLFLTGQDIVTAGIGGALFGGILTAATVLKRNVMSDIMRHI
ncbi:MAG: FAD-dependent oxidoreductase [Deltaproteobacteria bacterium RIFCSPLOWO2_02_FULL_50_16]|nr:MAG: FAD-dependent oxidoreductase [Deltaproteobacteria bacterium GWA2_50_8]OGQ27524.1 MAG: FAD-dependent oxidoreductase [Deltaproteobacteria bacterium RIFCSPHIGHO2_02_FULL_50_15]OGQ58182.1 MAG: FAD-dependent oxidoreductase [Deltaproteobacteria bacterium RIFCSPLOWO2_02_FULL_50_16]OGQ66861.1 MAG: FAD-dependent oxidoreductase [Deltaproteobacteria bacterium RIFCSPLOWO2_12_FULL_50_11]